MFKYIIDLMISKLTICEHLIIERTRFQKMFDRFSPNAYAVLNMLFRQDGSQLSSRIQLIQIITLIAGLVPTCLLNTSNMKLHRNPQ